MSPGSHDDGLDARSELTGAFRSDMGLHSRLETIEESLKQVQAMIPNLDTIAGPCEPTGSATSHMASTSHDVSTASSYTQTMLEADLVDGMGIMLADDHLDEDEDEDVEYFGTSFYKPFHLTIHSYRSPQVFRPTLLS